MKRICPRCKEPFMFGKRSWRFSDGDVSKYGRYMHKTKATCEMFMLAIDDIEPYIITFPSGQLDWAPNGKASLWTPKNGLTITLPARLPYTITEEELQRYLVLI